MKKITLLIAVLLVTVSAAFAQRTITGTVTDESGETLISVNVVVKGTTVGTVTDLDGKYSIKAPEGSDILVFSYTGFATQEVTLGASDIADVILSEGVLLNDVVVTALGIEREKKTLGYATQEVGGDEVTKVKDANFVNSLSGKIAGVDIRRSNQMGGSSNVIIRGYKNLSNNQALFVVDGIPLSNDNTNTTDQTTGRGGYDFGNAAMDINPEDIETINVLKGAAATALYGSRASNGVILITTKKGKKRKGLGVSVGTGVTFGQIDKTTAPRYQNEYGAGYGEFYSNGYFEEFDFGAGAGSGLSVPVGEDASYGGKFDGSEVYDWRSFHPEMTDWYGKKFPFSGTENNPNTFYETSATYNTNVAIDGGTDKATYRLSYTNFDQKGILPNSKIKKNTVSFNAGYDVTDKLKVTSSVNYVYTEGLGRYGTGYDGRNPNQVFRQWYNVAIDMEDQRRGYDETGENITWNPFGAGNPSDPSKPHYSDNFYFSRYENYATDNRSRMFGNIVLDYELTDWLTAVGRVTTDRYSELQEERIAVGAQDVSMYSRFNRSFYENNFDLFLNANKYLGADDKINLSGTIGTNIRKTGYNSVFAETNGGLVQSGLYALSNSASSIEAPIEKEGVKQVNGFYARATVGYANMLYLDLTGRQDYSSTLPVDNNSYFYPAASLSFVFSELMNSSFVDFGKLRLNYAQVGNDTDPNRLEDIYIFGTPFGVPISSVYSQKNNPDLRPERTNNIEAGVEMYFWNSRISLDASIYRSNTYDQIIPATVSGASGNLTKIVNAGNIQNQGVELAVNVKAIKKKDFTWDIGLNWARNTNEVLELYKDQKNLQLASVQGGVSINATVGESFGSIWGTNYVYDSYNDDGTVADGAKPVVESYGGGVRYLKTSSPEVIGNINPDWKGGINNRFGYKNLTFSFLVDIQKGGDFFSLDTWYGYATGLYDITAGTNSEGGETRALPADGGGIFIDGAVIETGTDASGNPVYAENTTAFFASDYRSAIGYANAPNAYHVWDASFVKLREVALTYSLPGSVIEKTPFQAVNVSLIGRNLWIIYKSSEYSDPESGLSSGNIQGNQSGVYPSVKELGINVNIKF